MCRLALIAAFVVALSSPAAAQAILKREPPPHSQPAFSSAYVDDGKCPKGKIKLVRFGSPKHMVKRHRSCVPRSEAK